MGLKPLCQGEDVLLIVLALSQGVAKDVQTGHVLAKEAIVLLIYGVCKLERKQFAIVLKSEYLMYAYMNMCNVHYITDILHINQCNEPLS